MIEIPQGTFFVAEACAGLRFLVASIAFGCLYALVMYRSPVRRGLFILASIMVPVVANGFRGLGIVALGYMLNSTQAAAADHIIYGWVFFSFVILMLIVVGLPFREDIVSISSVQPANGPEHRSGNLPVSMHAMLAVPVGVVVVAALSPMVAVALAMTLPRSAPYAGYDRFGPRLHRECTGKYGARCAADPDTERGLQRRDDELELGGIFATYHCRPVDGGASAAASTGDDRKPVGKLACHR